LDLFDGVPKFADVGVLLVDSEALKAMMIPSPTACLKAIQDYMPKLICERAQELFNTVGGMNPILAADPASVEVYVAKKKMKDLASTSLDGFRDNLSSITSLVTVMEDNNWPSQDNVKALMRMLKDSIQQLDVNVQLAEGKEEEEVKKFSLQITEECPRIVKNASLIREQLDKKMISDPASSEDKVIKFLAQQESDFNKLKDRKEKIQEYQVILKMPVE